MCLRDPNKHTLNKMSRCVCGYCIVEIMVAAWNTRDRYLTSTLSQAAIIKIASHPGSLSLLIMIFFTDNDSFFY